MNRWCRVCQVVWHSGLRCWNCGETGTDLNPGDCCKTYCIAAVHTASDWRPLWPQQS